MTLVYAKKIENLIYLITDTFSVDDYQKNSINWLSKPMRKIFNIGEKFVVAFSGNPHYIMEIFNHPERLKYFRK